MTTTHDIPTGNAYDKYASSNPIERRLVRGFMQRLDDALPASAPARILEVGVGEGEIATRVGQRYAGAAIVGLDLPDPSLAEHWHAKALPAAFGDIVALPFPRGAFELVLAIEVLEHVHDPEAALREIARVASGDVVLSVPWEPVWRAANIARGKYWKAMGNTPGHVQHWTRRGFVECVSRVLDVRAVYTPAPWTMLAARTRG